MIKILKVFTSNVSRGTPTSLLMFLKLKNSFFVKNNNKKSQFLSQTFLCINKSNMIAKSIRKNKYLSMANDIRNKEKAKNRAAYETKSKYFRLEIEYREQKDFF